MAREEQTQGDNQASEGKHRASRLELVRYRCPVCSQGTSQLAEAEVWCGNKHKSILMRRVKDD